MTNEETKARRKETANQHEEHTHKKQRTGHSEFLSKCASVLTSARHATIEFE